MRQGWSINVEAMTAVRSSARFGVGFVLVAAAAILVTMSHVGTASRGYSHDQLRVAPVGAPAISQYTQQLEAPESLNANEAPVPSKSGSAVSTEGAGSPALVVPGPRGGPADAGPDVVPGAQSSAREGCGPRPCPR